MPAQPPAAQDGQSQTTPATPAPTKDTPGVIAPGKTAEGEDKRIFGVLPNYRTAEMSAEFKPISAKHKLLIATKDSFAYTLMAIGAGYALLSQADNSHPQFGQGVAGYARRFGTSYADQAIGNYMTEGFMPILFKEDPRYFRMNSGPVHKRLWYAINRIVVTRTDSGKPIFNFSEIVGNGVASGIGLSYYEDSRDFPDFLQNWGTQIGTDTVSQILKEFWPDIKRRWFKRGQQNQAENHLISTGAN